MAYFISSFDRQNQNSLQPTITEVFFVGNETTIHEDDETDDNLIGVQYKLAITIIWSLLVITGVFGNGFVIFTIIKSKKFNNVIQCYLLHLAITDLLFVIFCIPITTLTYVQDHWVFGKNLCKIFHFGAFTTACATCLTLSMMTIDRYILICNINIKQRSSKCVLKVSIIIWLVSMCLSSPYLIFCDISSFKYNTTVTSTAINSTSIDDLFEVFEECRTTNEKTVLWNHISGWYPTAISYIIPTIIINFCYIRIMLYVSSKTANIGKNGSSHNQAIINNRKKKVGRTIFLFTSVFIILWFPIHTLSIWYRVDNNFPLNSPTLITIKLIAHTMSYANSTINPIIYAFSNELFKISFSNTFSCLFKRPSLDSNSFSLKNRTNLVEKEHLCDK